MHRLSPFRKAQATVTAVDERQQIESLTRDEKAQARTLASQKDKIEQLETQKNKLTEDRDSVGKSKEESKEKVDQLQAELAKVKQELVNHESEKRRIK